MQIVNKRVCPHCGQTISKRKITLYRGMVVALSKVYKWCLIHERHEFSRKEIKHLFTNENETARFGDWVMFGGILYKPEGRGHWGMNMERTEAFLLGDYEIPTVIWKDPVTKELEKDEYRDIHEIPSLVTMLDGEGAYIVEYKD